MIRVRICASWILHRWSVIPVNVQGHNCCFVNRLRVHYRLLLLVVVVVVVVVVVAAAAVGYVTFRIGGPIICLR